MPNQNCKEFYKLASTIETNWVVITGSPSSGKSTLLGQLLKLGYQVINDVAREIIEEMKQNSKPIDEKKKQLLIVERLLQKYCSTPRDKLVFLDYGMPDNLVFQSMAGFSIGLAERAAKSIRYRAVFLLEPLTIEYDGIRDLDYKTQHSIHNEILKKYIELNYNPIIIPSADLQYRLEIFLEYIKEIL